MLQFLTREEVRRRESAASLLRVAVTSAVLSVRSKAEGGGATAARVKGGPQAGPRLGRTRVRSRAFLPLRKKATPLTRGGRHDVRTADTSREEVRRRERSVLLRVAVTSTVPSVRSEAEGGGATAARVKGGPKAGPRFGPVKSPFTSFFAPTQKSDAPDARRTSGRPHTGSTQGGGPEEGAQRPSSGSP